MTLYRGIGGGGNATVDTELNLFTTLSQQAAQSATNASASEAAAEAAALAAANSAAAAETFNPSSSLVTYLPAGTGAVETTVQTKLRETVSLEDFGASATSTTAQNAAAFIAALQSGKRIAPPQQAYTFQFDGTPIALTGSVLDIDLGPFKHAFLNFGGISSDSVQVLRYNGRFSAGGGYCKGLGIFRNLQRADISCIEITDVFCDTPTSDKQFFGLEFSSSTRDDNQLAINVGNAVFKNIITKTPDFPSAIPMTGFGNFGSASSQSQRHVLHFANLHVEDFYTVSPADGVTVIGGDSDFFRLFTNPTNLTIENCYLKNVGKRFIKTQEEVLVTVNNLTTILDSRFSTANYNGTFEGQDCNSGRVSRFVIQGGTVEYPAGLSPVFFNASGKPHEIAIANINFVNLTGVTQSVDGKIHISNCDGSGFSLNAPSTTDCVIENCTITDLRGVITAKNSVRNCTMTLASDVVTTGFIFGGSSTLENVRLLDWDTNIRVAQFTRIKNLYLDRTRGTSLRRPFWPVNGQTCTFEDVEIVQSGGNDTGAAALESPGAGSSGQVICRDYRSTMGLGFVSSGTWTFFLDNCNSDSVTGAGVVSVTRALYGARLLMASGSLAFASIPANSVAELNLTVTGAVAVGGAVFVSPEANPGNGLSWSARISASNTVAVRVANNTTGAITPNTVAWRASVLQF